MLTVYVEQFGWLQLKTDRDNKKKLFFLNRFFHKYHPQLDHKAEVNGWKLTI